MTEEDEDDSFQGIAADLAVAKNREMEQVTGPFEAVLDDLGLGEPDELAEQILIYRGPPDRECFVCGESIPEDGRNPGEGEEYLIQRVNEADSPFPLTERAFHTECWREYRG
ncbi:MAG: hypothetical protein ABEJ60_03340 [Halodesulfurarchaeum sp.]